MFPNINCYQKDTSSTIFNTTSAKSRRNNENRINYFNNNKNIFVITSISKKTTQNLPQFDFLFEPIDKENSNIKNEKPKKTIANSLLNHYRNNFLKYNFQKLGKKKLTFHRKTVTKVKKNYSQSTKKKSRITKEDLYEITSPPCFQNHPKNYKSLNEIFIFDDAPKKTGQRLEGIVPMSESEKYKQYLAKRKKINFNIISNTSYAQKVCTRYLMTKVKVDNQKQEDVNKKYLIKEEKDNFAAIESRDVCEFAPMEATKILKAIKDFLRGGVKLNQRNLYLGNFYDFLENRINFVLDSNRLPNIRNNLIRILMNEEDDNKYLDWDYTNAIGYPTLEYLYKLKKKIQIEKDEKTKMIEQKNLIKKKYKFYKKLEKETYHDKEAIEKILFKNCYSKTDGNIVNIEKEIEDEFSDPFLIKDFFTTKNNNFETINIASDKLKNYVFTNFPTPKKYVVKIENKRNSIFSIKSS